MRSKFPVPFMTVLLAAPVYVMNLYVLQSISTIENIASRSAIDAHLGDVLSQSLPAAETIADAPSNYEVDFLRFSWHHSRNISDDATEANYRDLFSACWWQPRETFLKVAAFEKVTGSPEGASFKVFRSNMPKIRMTRDWLDLGVEHMSKWWKLVLESNDAVPSTIARIVDIFKDYTYSSDRKMFFEHVNRGNTIEEEEAVQVSASTLAMIAYMPGRVQDVTVWSLSATIMSLLQVGMGRIIVSGHKQTDEVLVRKAFSIVNNATRDWSNGDEISSKLEFCVSHNATTGINATKFNIPMAVMVRLRHVLMRKEDRSDVVSCWLGGSQESDRDRWKYLFLGEPDTILTTKPDALPGLTKALRSGAVLAPHRYQPLPHASDFSEVRGMGNKRNILPNAPPFKYVVEIDTFSPAQINSCCDRGKFKPWLLHEKCDVTFWWQCGFVAMRKPEKIPIIEGEGDCGRELTSVIVAHKRLLGYTLMRLKRGTGVVYASSESGKTCLPKSGQCIDEMKENQALRTG
mmetsp:Transcript_36582/g.65873  ORF Transcript_36582/g.65873 Transcript_36582/m.65873 type:complete len:518 (-) Transcript_36582:54-1607(-)